MAMTILYPERQSVMAWPTPLYSKSEINKAGSILAAKQPSFLEHEWALDVLSNWRSCHGYPINTFQATLRDKLARLEIPAGTKSIVAQRLKRSPSIIEKLRRFEKMQLARMQDIGGLRAVVPTLVDVRKVQDAYKTTRCLHGLVSEKDYITNPKSDGYRSVHLVFKYAASNPGAMPYNGLLLEMQIRTQLQHTWATAVETMGTFLGQALKSNRGDTEWLDFFKIVGSAFAYLESSPLVPGCEVLSKIETYRRVMEAENKLQVLDKLKGFSIATNAITRVGQGTYHLIVLDSTDGKVNVRGYPKAELAKAVEDYAKEEERANRGEKIEAVLVAAGAVNQLRRAYPNFFLDTQNFMDRVQRIIRTVVIASRKKK